MELSEKMKQMCDGNAFANFNHIFMKEYSIDHAVVELVVNENSLNPFGLVHGGALYTMGDCCGGIAAKADGHSYVTISSNLSFLQSGMPGDVIQARGTVHHRGRTTCYVEVELVNQKGELLARGSYTYYRVD